MEEGGRDTDPLITDTITPKMIMMIMKVPDLVILSIMLTLQVVMK